MTDLHEEHNNRPEPKKPKPLLELAIGVGTSLIAYILISAVVSIGRFQVTVQALIAFLIVAAFGFITVKCFRTGHKIAAVIMLALISPLIFVLLLMGACSILL